MRFIIIIRCFLLVLLFVCVRCARKCYLIGSTMREGEAEAWEKILNSTYQKCTASSNRKDIGIIIESSWEKLSSHGSRTAIFNHFIFSEMLVGWKSSLAKRLTAVEKCALNSSLGIEFRLPHSYFPNTVDRDEWTEQSTTHPVIIKPDYGFGGLGVSVAMTAKDVEDVLSSSPRKFVVQKYVQNPMLINGYKLDLRVFVLVTKLSPFVRGYIHQDEIPVRVCSEKYSMDTSETVVHVTNPRQHGGRGRVLNAKEAFTAQKWSGIWENITSVVSSSLLSLPPRAHRDLTFELYGIDMLIDEDGGAWILEFNTAPMLYMTTGDVEQLLRDAFGVVLAERRGERVDLDQWTPLHERKEIDNELAFEVRRNADQFLKHENRM